MHLRVHPGLCGACAPVRLVTGIRKTANESVLSCASPGLPSLLKEARCANLDILVMIGSRETLAPLVAHSTDTHESHSSDMF